MGIDQQLILRCEQIQYGIDILLCKLVCIIRHGVVPFFLLHQSSSFHILLWNTDNLIIDDTVSLGNFYQEIQ